MEKFWSDDFDMDLLKLFPDLERILGATATIKLWTVGHETFGRLNHPCFWNTPEQCLFWLEKPNLVRDQHGWFKVNGMVANEPEIECTWLEVLRDVWAHHIGFTILPYGTRFRASEEAHFDRIMYHIRGWHEHEDVQYSHAKAFGWIIESNKKFAPLVEQSRLGREDYPYFAPGSVPWVNAPRIPLRPLVSVVAMQEKA